MAISSETSSATFTGNNSTSTAYTLAFPFSGSTELVVTHIEEDGTRNTLAVTTGYTLHGDYPAGAGTLKTVAAIPTTDSLLVERFTAAVQSLDSDSPAGSYPTSIETQLDRSTRAIQDGKRIASRNFARSLRVPDGELAAELPAAAVRKGELVYFNATTGAPETKTPNEILALSGGAPDGIGIPAGGTTGQALVKTSGTDYDVEWDDVLTDIDVEGERDRINRQPYSSKHISTWTGSTARPLRVAIAGDSLAVLGPLAPGPRMLRSGWIGGGYGTSSGTITATTNDHAAWLTGVSMQFASGSSAEFSCGQASPAHIRGDRFVLYYLKKSGGGTFDLQYESADAIGTWTTFSTVTNGADGNNVSAANGSTIGAVFSATLPLTNTPAYKVRINDVTGGGVTVIAAGIENSGGGGITWIPSLLAKGGLDFSSFVGVTPSAVYAPILADLAPHLILSCWADASTNWDTGGAFRTFYSWFPAADWVQISASPALDESNHAAQRASQRAWALEAGQSYVNGHAMFGSYAAAREHSLIARGNDIAGAATTSGSANITFSSYGASGPSGLVIGTGIPAGTTIVSSTTTTAVLSAPATATNTGLTFEAWDVVHLSTAGGVFRNHVLWSNLPIGDVHLGAIGGDGSHQPVQQYGGGAGIDDGPLRLQNTVLIEGALAELALMDQAAPLVNGRRARFYCNNGHLYVVLLGTGVNVVFPAGSSGFAGISPTFTGAKLGGFGGFNWDAALRNLVTTGTTVDTPDTLSGAGAIPITTGTTLYTSTGAAQALTLANGTAGQIKRIVHDVDGGSGVLTPTTKTGFSTITFTNAGDTVTLQYFTTRGWMVIGSYGVTIAP